MEDSKDIININSSKNDLLLQIEIELHQIINYIQNNLMNNKNKDINLDEKETQNKRIVKLGIKRKRIRKLNEDDKDKMK